MKQILFGRGLAAAFAFGCLAAPSLACASAPHATGLFGTSETFSSNLAPFTKWTEILRRMKTERSVTCTGARLCVAGRWQHLVAELRALPLRARVIRANDELNRVPYVSSAINWHDPDHWETPLEFLARGGQCEDYAIAKIMVLIAAGTDPDAVRLVIVRDRDTGLDHAVAVAYVEGEAMLLDNQIKAAADASLIDRYAPYYAINEAGWWRLGPPG
jgi:predicted transglutaminase-like cysteine proteinase